ncbi:MAG: hypothetical protein HYX63_02630 [Gammaproteobacteria bacterium]|nr:hypothetical protein [Gammaproteobacteria bacterium]
MAAVSGAELLATCGVALAHGYRGVDSAMCEWYVNPCVVCGSPARARWCLPPTLRDAELAAVIVHELQSDPQSLTRDAKELVKETLTAQFPCAAD